jgi:hypothetical protein
LGTVRSEYSIEQFEEAFQKFAHKVAMEVQRFSSISLKSFDGSVALSLDIIYNEHGEPARIEVYYDRILDTEKWLREWFAFTVEPKEYFDSPHVSKIHYEGSRDKAYDERIKEWVRKLMDEAGLKPKPRFSLKDLKTYPRKLDIYLPQKAETQAKGLNTPKA